MSRLIHHRSHCALRFAASLMVSCSALALAPAASAQQEGGDAGMTEVVVTGSRIHGAAPVGSPVIAATLDDASVAGAVTTAQILEQVPQIFNLGVSESSRGQNGGSGNITYGSSINIRGIGPYATLTLLDGHRVVPQGTTGQAVDPSVIPMIALKQVDILADGASAIYGSDAVAGVANLILRRNVEGVEGTVRYGGADHYDEKLLSVLAGHTWNSGQFTLALEHGDHTSLNGADRDFFSGNLLGQGGGDYRVVQCNPGNLVVGGVSYALPSRTAGTNKCDNLKYEDLIPKQVHNSGTFTFDQELTDSVSLYAQGFMARRDFKFTPSPLTGALTVPSSNAFYETPVGLNPASETVNYSFIGVLPPNTSSGYSQSFNGTAGVTAELPLGWKIDADFGYGRDDDESVTLHGINNAALNQALASGNPATAFNPFGGANNAAVLNAISNSIMYAPGTGELKTVEAKLDGPLFDFPGGPVRLAVGGEYQDYTLATGSTTGTQLAPLVTTVNLSRNVKSLYTEVFLPVIGKDNNIPFIRSLDFDLAGRMDQYSDVGVTRNPKAGVNLSPIDDLMLRGDFGTSFRAPLPTQLHAQSQGLYVQNYSDPTCGCIRQGLTLSGGNPDLHPETATTYSAGFDYKPSFLPHAKFSATYFYIDYDNQIASYLADLTVLNREASFNGTGIINRNPSQAFVNALLAQYRVLAGVVPSTVTLYVDGRQKNLSRSVSQGFDFSGNYDIPTDDLGLFRLGLTGTYFMDYSVGLTPSASLIQEANTIYNPLRLKMRGSLGWDFGRWGTGLYVNYVNSYNNNLTKPTQTVDAYTTVDLHLSYDLSEQAGLASKDKLSVSFDVSNLFDTNPPFVNIAESANGGGGFDATTTNPIGRIVSMSLGFKF